MRGLANEFPEIEIYLENTLEQKPYIFEKTAKALSDVSALVEVNDLDSARRSLEHLAGVFPGLPEPQSSDVPSRILDIGIALTAERDPDKLLDMIVDTAMSLTGSDGGTLYIPDGDVLRFKISKTRSRGINLGGNGDAPDIPPVPLCKEHICAYSAITGKSINIADVYSSTEFDFSGPKKYDALNNYRTKSMVTIPLLNKSNETVGVLQLINAQTNGVVRAFTAEEERIIRSLGSQIAIALSNMRYLRELNEQMWSFTVAMTEATDHPYKKPLSMEQAFSILRGMADEGKIELRLVNYLESCLSEEYRAR